MSPRRVLIESPDPCLAWIAEDTLLEEGIEVTVCPVADPARCRLIDCGRCELVEQADVIVQAFGDDPHPSAAIRGTIRLVYPTKPVCVLRADGSSAHYSG